MTSILSPALPKDDPDRFLRCQDALQIAFQELFDNALAAGRDANEIACAITELADSHMLMRSENGSTEALLNELKKRPLRPDWPTSIKNIKNPLNTNDCGEPSLCFRLMLGMLDDAPFPR